MTDLQVLLLGPPEARFMGENIQIPRRLPRALLFYLASQGGVIGRDHILTLFWEEEPEASARRNLRDTLSRLKNTLPDPDLLYTDTSLVGLNFQRTTVDQIQFQDMLERLGRTPWQIPAEQPLPETTYRLMKSAVELWRSPNFLAGANFPSTTAMDDWLSYTSQRLEQQYGRIVQRLADHAFAVGDLGSAFDLTNAALVNDGLNEDLHLRLMQILVRMDRPGDARQHYRALSRYAPPRYRGRAFAVQWLPFPNKSARCWNQNPRRYQTVMARAPECAGAVHRSPGNPGVPATSLSQRRRGFHFR